MCFSDWSSDVFSSDLLRFGAAVVGTGGGVEGGGIDVIASGNNRQVFRLDLGVDLGAAGDDFEVVDVVGVEACAFDGADAFIKLNTIQRSEERRSVKGCASTCRFRGMEDHSKKK